MNYYPRDPVYPLRRALVVAAVLALHVIVIGAFWTSVIVSRGSYLPTELRIDVLPRARPSEPLSVAAVILKESTMIQVVVPEIAVAAVADDIAPPIQSAPEQQDETVHPEVPAPPAPGPRPNVRPHPIYVPGGKDRYPAESRLARETGTPTITICISATGAVETVQVTRSSGFPRLDQAAVAIGKDARFKPASLDGKPVPDCTPYRIKFAFLSP